ncbi:MAG: hypothetical protein KAJ16_10625 [Calditrichia bacterium]|nr:hypothetical protein [Calditrichia bacterium]
MHIKSCHSRLAGARQDGIAGLAVGQAGRRTGRIYFVLKKDPSPAKAGSG